VGHTITRSGESVSFLSAKAKLSILTVHSGLCIGLREGIIAVLITVMASGTFLLLIQIDSYTTFSHFMANHTSHSPQSEPWINAYLWGVFINEWYSTTQSGIYARPGLPLWLRRVAGQHLACRIQSPTEVRIQHGGKSSHYLNTSSTRRWASKRRESHHQAASNLTLSRY
jgi:hypothetical protein